MKQHNLISHLDSEEKKMLICQTPPKEEKPEDFIKDNLKEKYSPDKLVRISSLASNFDDKKFYKTNYQKKSKQERDVENYEIVSKNGYDQLEPTKIKALFTNKG